MIFYFCILNYNKNMKKIHISRGKKKSIILIDKQLRGSLMDYRHTEKEKSNC